MTGIAFYNLLPGLITAIYLIVLSKSKQMWYLREGKFLVTPDEKMKYVIGLAERAMDNGELPIAAAVYNGDELVSSAYTTERADGRWLIHAELKAL